MSKKILYCGIEDAREDLAGRVKETVSSEITLSIRRDRTYSSQSAASPFKLVKKDLIH